MRNRHKEFHSRRWKGVCNALIAAVLFGISTPLAKVVSATVNPALLAGLLYLGSGLGLGVYTLIRGRFTSQTSKEAALSRTDIYWLAGAILAGGVVGPVLLMWGLIQTPASTASLLLNLEGVVTAILAWFVFHESFDNRIAFGMALIASGGVCLSWLGRPEGGDPSRILAIVGACCAWALDNNLTRKVSAGDPVQIAMFKGLVAGTVNIIAGLAWGASLPSIIVIIATCTIGIFGYGLSLVLFVLALRHIGTARTGAYFSIAPFVGAITAILLLGEKLSAGLYVSATLMGVGVWLHLTERHEHEHQHESTKHNHLHSHDIHHNHTHGIDDPPEDPHSHLHRHEELLHSHQHFPDIHHRHKH